MGSCLRSCLRWMLKTVNSVIGMAGMAMILYSLWMLSVWYKQTHSFWTAGGSDSTPPWFIYTFLALGVSTCLITCFGHIAAETANGHCLCCYMVYIFVLVFLEAAVAADVFLNRNWEEDLPEDPTGKLDEFKEFVRSNFDMCKWIGLSILTAQAVSIFLAMVLRALGPHCESFYDSDNDYEPARLPLLQNEAQQTPYAIEPHSTPKNDPWKTRIHQTVIPR